MGFIEDSLEFKEVVLYEGRVHWMAHVMGLAVLLLVFSPRNLSRTMTTKLALTHKRVMAKSGLFLRKTIDMPYTEVQAVRVSQDAFGGLLGYGTVTLVKTDGTKLVCYGIARPQEVKDKINEQVELAVLGRKLALPPNEALPEAMPIREMPVKKTPTIETPAAEKKPPVQW